MADTATLLRALRKADALAQEGDAQAATDAKRLADLIRERRARAETPAATEAAPEAPRNTGLVEQATAGAAEGAAGLLTLPATLGSLVGAGIGGAADEAINALGRAFGVDFGMPGFSARATAGAELPAAMVEDAGKLVTDVAPQTAAQRIARNYVAPGVVGAAIAGPAMGLRGLGANAANAALAAASGTAGGVTEEVTGSPLAGAAVDLLGGVGGGVALGRNLTSRAARSAAEEATPSLDSLKAERAAKYDQATKSDFRLTPEQRGDLVNTAEARVADDLDPDLHREAAAGLRKLQALPESPSLNDLEQARRFIVQNSGRDAATGRLTGALVDEIDGYLGRVAPDNADITALTEARKLHRQIKAAEDVNAIRDRAALRKDPDSAAVASLRSVVENPRKARSFTPDQLGQIKEIVGEAVAPNPMETLTSFMTGSSVKDALTRGALGSLAFEPTVGLGLALAGPAAKAALQAAARKLGYVGRADADLRELERVIRGGRPMREFTDAEQQILIAVLGGQAAGAAGSIMGDEP